MNQGQSNLLAFLQQLVLNAGSAQVFADQNMAIFFSAHSAPHIQSHCQALLDALSAPAVQAAVAKLQEDIILVPEIAQLT